MSSGEVSSNLLSKTMVETVKAGNDAKVGELIAADPELAKARDEAGVSALLWSVYAGQKEITELLLASGLKLDIFEAAACGNVDRVRELLAQPVLVATHSPDGWTPLHLAAAFNQKQVVELLLQNGAEVDSRSRNSTNNTALNACVALSHSPEIAKILLQHGAGVNAKQAGGFTPLHLAAFQGDKAMLELLLAHHADPRIVTDQGKTALDLAREKQHSGIEELLIEAGPAS